MKISKLINLMWLHEIRVTNIYIHIFTIQIQCLLSENKNLRREIDENKVIKTAIKNNAFSQWII